METYTQAQITDEALADWRLLATGLHARFKIADFRRGGEFVSAVCTLAEQMNHHPEIRLTYGNVDISTVSHDAGGQITVQDIDLARSISALAKAARFPAQATEITQLELALDTANGGAIAPFWSALLTGEADNVVRDVVVDPSGRVPRVWFQEDQEPRNPNQRWHFDLWLAPEVASARIAAAVAAGGEVVSTQCAPGFTVLADVDGNRVCVCVTGS